ncbi:hypothetical protein GF377_04310 [candidate division GN15 bacterium]|nr:hypothetical protein [candidate division GN15 bacterium]
MKNLGKILFVVLLLAALVGISYVKSMRDKEREEAAKQSGREAGRQALVEQQAAADSLQALLEASGTEFEDSIESASETYARQVDSLSGLLDSQSLEIAALEAEKESLATRASEAKESSGGKAAHRDILAHYRKEVQDLPADLSAYERRVALKEVRSHTAQKFAITVKRLNEIRQQYNIDY